MSKDRLFHKKMKPSSFSFNQEVAEVFPDMLERSIPGYRTKINSIRFLASKYSKKGTNCYDLGCSLGASSIALGEGAAHNDCRIMAVDKSSSMTKKFSEIIKQEKLDLNIQIYNEDVFDTKITNASIVIMNFTLQFIRKKDRQLVLDKIYNGLNDGGLLILSEKITQGDKANTPVNEQQSGKYLILHLCHHFDPIKSYTSLTLARDTYCLYSKE